MRRDRKDERLFSLRGGMGKGHVYLCIGGWGLMQWMRQGARVPDIGGWREFIVGPVLRALANPIHLAQAGISCRKVGIDYDR